MRRRVSIHGCRGGVSRGSVEGRRLRRWRICIGRSLHPSVQKGRCRNGLVNECRGAQREWTCHRALCCLVRCPRKRALVKGGLSMRRRGVSTALHACLSNAVCSQLRARKTVAERSSRVRRRVRKQARLGRVYVQGLESPPRLRPDPNQWRSLLGTTG